MKRNPLIPFAMIAIVGVLAVIVISFVGNHQRTQIAEGDEGQADNVIMEDPEEIYETSCLHCHGADLSGGMGPALDAVGSELSLDEIKDIITNGTEGGMPAQQGQLAEEEIAIISEWLSEKK
ncbi:cytochrome c550 [Ornithinibacillus sp. FSL M8-0202]|uniref:cytochrome c550 n=1 Tax=unclassified Ornithinibacillus TaxID=2620869 RepID=UPI0030D1230F